ncbi:MAG: tryptophan--tRNA ligase [Acidiphilium sp. 37-67-22]|nr:MAG: tryptophan--tRNA ligase [Acidiphilium sp. 37-67-22]
MARIFSGIQPTGIAHLGNYLGAIQNWVALQEGNEGIYCLVDLHALTVWVEPEALRQQTRVNAALLVACGIDPTRSILFHQSAVHAHARLAWIFNCVARFGWLNRMTQFKDKAGKDREAVSTGLFVYPNLMAADILAYHATEVPVGEDQSQHLELANDIAQKFNHDYGVEFFPAITPRIIGGSARMEPLPERPAQLDSRPEARNLVGIYAALADITAEEVLRQHAGNGFGPFKERLTELAVQKLTPIGAETKRLAADPAEIDRMLQAGAARAATIAAPIVAEAERLVGLLPAG